MAQNPPPPPPPGYGPPAYGPSGAGSRPGVVTAAAVLLFIVGGLNAIGGLILITAASIGAFLVLIGILSLGIAAAEIYAGAQVMALKERGRIIGTILAVVGLVFQLLAIAKAPGSSILGICIQGFIIWALVSNAQYFTP